MKKAEVTRNEIFETAMGLFHKQGYEKTTMRQIAHEAGKSLGSTYYHFENKKDLIQHFYLNSLKDSEQEVQRIINKSNSLKIRMEMFMQHKFEQLQDHRDLCKSILGHGLNHKFSPLGSEAEKIRTASIQMFDALITGTTVKKNHALYSKLPNLLWSLQMILILAWLNDSSESQKVSKGLSNQLIKLFTQYLSLAKIPIFKSINSIILDSYEIFSTKMESSNEN